jgi:hypothetical protein
MPITIAIARPVKVTSTVFQRASPIFSIVGPSRNASVMTSCGGGMRNRRPGSSSR